ncbi:hypothetical protein AA309_30625 [Microvirga vignae]|uniref:Uncharacterized protein n=1 Tax=Microvirga vignae TaxID=1225564 RepID=A0A0H1R3F8_9HYPH|nr:hypothetical protein [Microvirga vignae]KLK89579.1 hypothetical protein AA309_30625 [Microvirga vignae]
MRTCNLFRRTYAAGLYCAVPENVPVPAFVPEDRWKYGQSLDIGALSGFDADTAHVSTATNGSYLFHSVC